LGEALMRTLPDAGYTAAGIDIVPSAFTTAVGSIADRAFVRQCMNGVEAVFHAATLHKPHVVTHSYQDFVDTNITGTLVLLEEAVAAGVESFIFTSTTSAFGRALTPMAGMPAAWITEDVAPVPKNIYGVTKVAAEGLCELLHRSAGLPCVILRTSRFFPEADDNAEIRRAHDDANIKVNEFLYRRVDVEDVVAAHQLALQRAKHIGFGRYIISATTPFTAEDVGSLRVDAAAVLRRRVPGYEEIYVKRGWTMFRSIDRVYVNDRARAELAWRPRYDFARALACIDTGHDYRSPLAQAIGSKGYHSQTFSDGPYPVAPLGGA
jgi:UDP-glucose 4-epimerase